MTKQREIIAKELLDILACPLCKTDIELVEIGPKKHGLRCVECRRVYPIEDGIPVMLVDEAIAPPSG